MFLDDQLLEIAKDEGSVELAYLDIMITCKEELAKLFESTRLKSELKAGIDRTLRSFDLFLFRLRKLDDRKSRILVFMFEDKSLKDELFSIKGFKDTYDDL